MAKFYDQLHPEYIYVWLRQRLPSPLVRALRHTPLLLLARLFYTQPVARFPCQGALTGHILYMPKPFIWSMVYGEHEPHVQAFIQRTVKRGYRVLDVGAHIGYETLLLASCVGPDGRVTAFEPLLSNVQLLRKNVVSNGYEQRVRIVPVAAGASAGLMDLSCGPGHSQGSLVRPGKQYNVRVEVAAIDDVVPQGESVHFVKIDVEGAGHLVLAGMQRLITTQRPVVLMEIHSATELAALHALPDYEVMRLEGDASLVPVQQDTSMKTWPEHRVAVPLETL